jgi:hypothetical protein
VLLVAAYGPVFWSAAMMCCGSFDALRFIATGIVGRVFEGMPLAWGYAIFDTVMGTPMVGGAILGGLLHRAAYTLPFVLVIAVSAVLLVGLLFAGSLRSDRADPRSGRELAETTD